MKTLFGIVLALLLVAAAATPQQKQSGMGIPVYSPSQEKTFSGIVAEVTINARLRERLALISQSQRRRSKSKSNHRGHKVAQRRA